ncbi:MAG: SAM-dependent DNA methyltransferase [Bdellovibrionaceae bacterium]|nr:SAM-dependent DNA methyltransferase [Pseudobdellovibrionaceae bacterium]
MEKEFESFRRQHQLNYKEAYRIFLKLCAGGLVGKLPKEFQPYEESALPLIKSFLETANKNPYRDNLGELWMWVVNNYGKAENGQFFTPKDVCELISKMMMDRSDYLKLDRYNSFDNPFKFEEPCCGSGAMVIPVYRDLMNNNPDLHIELFLNDLDEVCTIAAFIQITLLMIHLDSMHRTKLVVTRGNILTHPHGEELRYAVGLSNDEILKTEWRILNSK